MADHYILFFITWITITWLMYITERLEKQVKILREDINSIRHQNSQDHTQLFHHVRKHSDRLEKVEARRKKR